MVLKGKPHISGRVAGRRQYGSSGDTLNWDQPIILHVPDSVKTRDPNSPVVVLAKRKQMSNGPPAPAVDRNSSVLPFAQTPTGIEPDASIPVDQKRAARKIPQTLIFRKSDHGAVAEAVKTRHGPHPEIAFAIFKERVNGISGETIGLRKHVGPPVVYVHQASILS